MWARRKLPNLSQNTLLSYAFLTLAAIIYVLGVQTIMQVAKVLPSGVSALATVAIFLAPQLSPYFGLLYLALNVPLIIIFFNKLRRRFMYRTIFFLVVSAAVNGLFAIDVLSNAFANFVIRVPAGESVDQFIINAVWPKLVLPPIGGILIGAAIAFSWKYGGSSGGLDIAVYYFSTRFKKPVGSLGFVFAVAVLAVSFAIFVGLDELQRRSWLPTLIGSVLYLVVSSFMINLIYPRYAKVLVEVHSVRIAEMEQLVRGMNRHAFRILKGRSGYSGGEFNYLSTVMLLVEAKDFIRRMRQLDPDVWISVIKVSNVVGRFDTSSVD